MFNEQLSTFLGQNPGESIQSLPPSLTSIQSLKLSLREYLKNPSLEGIDCLINQLNDIQKKDSIVVYFKSNS